MDKVAVIREIAEVRMVETIVASVAHRKERGLDADLQDLCQMVYLTLLEYEEDKILDLYENKQMQFFIVRIVLNQLKYNPHSRYRILIRRFKERSVSLGADIAEAEERM